jgi:hypothetical protein
MRFNPAGKEFVRIMTSTRFQVLVKEMAFKLKRFDTSTCALLRQMHSPKSSSESIEVAVHVWLSEADCVKDELSVIWKKMCQIDKVAAEEIYCLEGIRRNVSSFVLAVRKRAFLVSGLSEARLKTTRHSTATKT